MFSLKGKTALVTGASRGIGRAVALAFARAGAEVLLASRSREPLEAVKAEIEKEGGKARVYVMDMADAASIASTLDAILKDVERVDCLVNNAGITRDGLIMRMSDEDWSAVIETNLTGAFRVTRGVLRGMMKARWGRVINISSVIAEIGNAGQANYAASKAGLIGFTKSLAHELASRNITANAVAPGYIGTNMTDALDEKQKAAVVARIPAGRIGAPEDVAAAVLFLASEEASYVTGQVLHVGGGIH